MGMIHGMERKTMGRVNWVTGYARPGSFSLGLAHATSPFWLPDNP